MIISPKNDGTWRTPIPQPVLAPGSLAIWQARQVAAYVELRLDSSLPAADLAAVARTSVGHFSRAFKVSFGCTPHAYVLHRRIEHAKYLIAGGASGLAEVALCCGLADQSHLSRLFRKIVGESPRDWRRRCWVPADLPALPQMEGGWLSTATAQGNG